MIKQNRSTVFLIELISIESLGLKHAICSLISIVACTPAGVDYLTSHGNAVAKQIMDIVKLKIDDCDDGSVAQRFCLATL